MGLRIQEFLPTPNGGQAGGTGSLNLPLGATYYNLSLDISDGSTAMTLAALQARIYNLRLKVNGTVVRQYDDISHLVNINKMHGIETRFGTADGEKSARVVMHFAEPQRRTPVGEDIFAWQMYDGAGIKSFTLEYDVKDTASSSFAVQVSREYAVFSGITKLSPIVWHSSQTLPNDSAGKPTTSTLQKTSYTRIHAIGGTGVLTGAKVKVNGLPIREFRKLQEYKDYMYANGLNTIDNIMSIVFDNTNRYNDFLDVRGASSFELEFTSGAAGAIRLLLEELKGL